MARRRYPTLSQSIIECSRRNDLADASDDSVVAAAGRRAPADGRQDTPATVEVHPGQNPDAAQATAAVNPETPYLGLPHLDGR